MESRHPCTAIAVAMLNALSVSTLCAHPCLGRFLSQPFAPHPCLGRFSFLLSISSLPPFLPSLFPFSAFSTLGNCCFPSAGFVRFCFVGHTADLHRRWGSAVWLGRRVLILRGAGGPQFVCRLLRRLSFSFVVVRGGSRLVEGGCCFVLVAAVGN